MNFTQLRAFDMVAREGSFTRAAQQLGVTQPALTIQVKALEETYGVKLLDRAGRGVSLTEAGTSLFDVTRRLFALEEEAQELLAASRELRRGHLRVAADGPHIVMGMFAQFRRRFPEVRLMVTLGNTAYVRQQLLERRVDVGILPVTEEDETFVRVPLWRHTPVLIVPLRHPWARRKSVRIADLDGQPMLMREEGSNTQRALEAALRRAGARPRVVLELGSREAVLGAVAAGLGFGVVWKVEATGDGRFRALDIRDPAMRSFDHVACLRSERNRRVVRAMMDMAKTIHRAGTVLHAGTMTG
ncbi:MAG: LysR family transcriptional regulator [Alphaproteobacteria bacterium]|nr:LysR family transcriptional regulator [Alphaproteobacteria bacterium]